MPSPWSSLLLLGPTGSGKSPLGDLLEQRGLAERPCAHFDFGRCLRRAAEIGSVAERQGLTDAERATIVRVLREGALLEKESRGIALKLFDGFLRGLNKKTTPLLILNGLPRQAEQAQWLDGCLRVEAVVRLECDAGTVAERIRKNSDGDRTGRSDDDPESVRRRLALYRARIAPLADYYTARGARLMPIPVGPDTSAEQAWRHLAAIFGQAPQKKIIPI